MKLTIYDRITLSNLLPAKTTSYEQAIVVKDLRKKLTLTQEELETFKVHTEGRGEGSVIVWSDPNNVTVELTFTSLEQGILDTIFTEISSNGNFLTDDKFIDLYEKIHG